MVATDTDDTAWVVGAIPLRRTTSGNYTTWWLSGPRTGGTILCGYNRISGVLFTGSFLPDGVYTRQYINADALDLFVDAFLVVHEAEIVAAIATLEGS